MTTVRAEGLPTQGFELYDGFPRNTQARKRKGPFGSEDVTLLREPRFKREEAAVEKPAIMKLLRARLVLHSPKYDACVISARYASSPTECYRVLLSGDNSSYCLNKQGYHKSQHVYMCVDLAPDKRTYVSYMRCWCRCDGGNGRVTGIPCSKFKSPWKSLSVEEALVLFPGVKGLVSAHPKVKAAQKEGRLP